jgi:hypothetical protein
MDRETRDLVIRLYETMPGAPMPPKDEDGYLMWAHVEHNEHWQFCEAIVTMTVRLAQAYAR